MMTNSNLTNVCTAHAKMSKTTGKKAATAQSTATQRNGAPTKAKPTASKRSATLLKTAVIVGSLVATFMGADLAARNDQTVAIASTSSVVDTGKGQLSSPQQFASVPNPATTDTTLNQLLNPQLAPIPKITMRTITARTRSSR